MRMAEATKTDNTWRETRRRLSSLWMTIRLLRQGLAMLINREPDLDGVRRSGRGARGHESNFRNEAGHSDCGHFAERSRWTGPAEESAFALS